MLKRLSRRSFALLALPLVLNIASCRTRDSAGASSRLRTTTPVVASYGDDFEVYYHWGDATFLDRLTNTHIPNHIYPGEEKAYGYYSNGLYQEVMNYPYSESNVRGAGLYVASDPISSIQFAFFHDNPKLIEVIIDKRVAAANTLISLDDSPPVQVYGDEWFVIKKNKGIYFREFSGAGFSAAALRDFKSESIRPDQTWKAITYFGERVDAIIKNPPKEKVRMLPPREWVCPS